MGIIRTQANNALRNFETVDVPATGVHEPTKDEMREVFGTIEDQLAAAAEGSGYVLHETVDDAEADDQPDGTWVRVLNDDGSPPANGFYQWQGSSLVFVAANADEVAEGWADAAEASADLAEAAAQSVIPPAGLLVGLGDSITQANVTVLGGAISTVGNGEIVQALARYPFARFTNWIDAAAPVGVGFLGANLGRSGTDSDEALIDDGKVLAPACWWLSFGINNLGHGWTAADTAADLIVRAELCRMTGAPVIMTNIRANSTDALHAGIIATNALIQDYWDSRPAGVIPCDLYSVYAADPDSPTNADPKPGYLSDGTHPSATGAQAAAPVIVECLRQVFQPINPAVPTGTNLVGNPTYTGTTGDKSTGASGQLAAQYFTTRTGAGTGLAVFSKGDGDVQEVEITPQPGGEESESFYINRTFGAPAINVTAGLWYVFGWELEYSDWAGWRNLWGSGVAGSYCLYSPGSGQGSMGAENKARKLWLISMPTEAPADANVNPLLFLTYDGEAAGSGKLRILRQFLCQVPDPRELVDFDYSEPVFDT